MGIRLNLKNKVQKRLSEKMAFFVHLFIYGNINWIFFEQNEWGK
ncbi:hypothetical protein N824_06240 [Pedobacter sp. V48]|nr:hypothetical protein N824_06240 [Pedobacter sp. V48]